MKLSVGLEFNERYLKLVAVKPQAGQPKLYDCIIEPIVASSNEQITKTVTEIFKRENWKPKTLIVSLPRNLVTMRNLHLPTQDPREIDQMIDLHISRIVPYRKEEVTFGHLQLGIDEMNYTKETLAIVHNDILKGYMKILEVAGLTVDKILLSSYGVWQWAMAKYSSEIKQDELYVLLDVDSAFTDFIIFNKDHLLFSRAITLEVRDPLPQVEINKFIGEVRQSLLIFHKTEEIARKPVTFFLAGAWIEDLHTALKKEFDTPLRLVPVPYSDELLKTKKRELPKDISISAVSEFLIEESSQRIPFLLPEMQIRKSLKEKARELTILGTMLVYLFTMLAAFFWERGYTQQFYLRRLLLRNKIVEQDVGNLAEQAKKIEFIKDLLYQRKIPALFMYELQKVLPDDISINYISMDKDNKITLRGQGIRLSDVFRFVTTLENSKYFKDVSTKYTRAKKIRDREVTDFEIGLLLTLSKK